ncbi:MAG: FixH family protein [Pseudomonadota bacterium]|nr:FixH family protein [Pseudomonadota bacterium]
MDNEHNETASSPWRQPIIWLVIALVAAAVAGGVVMIRVAGGSVDSVPDKVQRTAGAQTADLAPDEVAMQRRLSAVVRVDARRGLVQVLPASEDFERDAPLRLSLHHPLHAAMDTTLALVPTELGWEAAAEIDSGHDWNLQLVAADGRWRLLGRLPKGQQAARVAPALQED